jgi:UDPglucose 6-dehydrogenase
LLAFRAVAREAGYDFHLLDSVMRINQDQRHQCVRKVRDALWTLRDKRITVLGLAFKAGTDDVRESPAIEIIEALLWEGCVITAYDPVAMPRAQEQIHERLKDRNVEMASDPYAAAKDSDAVLILTEWSEFASLDLARLRRQMRLPVVIDGRNLYHPEEMEAAGLAYYSLGRAAVFPTDRSSMMKELLFEETA